MSFQVVQRSKNYLVHDPAEQAKLGDTVIIQNCRPISATKSFEFVKKLAQARTLERETAQEASHVAPNVS